MNGWTLTLSYVRRRKLDTLLNVLLLALGIATIVVLLLVGRQMRGGLARDSEGIDAVVGAKGSPIQLILSSIFHLDVPTGNIPLRDAEAIERQPLVAQAIPLALGDNYEGYPIVGTDHQYPAHYGAELASGRLWDGAFEVVAGARVARERGLTVGDELISTHGLHQTGDDHDHHEHGLHLVGILEPTGTVVDRVVMSSVETIWDVHRTDENREVLPDKQQITALLVRYRSPAAAILFPRYVNSETQLQAASPAFETVRLFSILGVGFDAIRSFGLVLIVTAALSIFISLYNTMRARRADLAILRTLGASRSKLLRHVLLEGTLLAALGTIVGLALGHLATEILGQWSRAARQMDFHGRLWVPEELWLIVAALGVGVVAAVLPAIQAYRIDIAETLARK